MKYIHNILICCLLGLSLGGYSQEPERPLEPNDGIELFMAINHTIPVEGLEPRAGFGIGLRIDANKYSKLSGTFGVEYNMTRVFIPYFDATHFSSARDVTVAISSFTIPINLRVKLGSKMKFIIETGVFIEVNGFSRVSGTTSGFVPYGNSYSRPYKGSIGSGFYFGPNAGLGVHIPYKSNELIIRAEYKHGIIEPDNVYRGFSNNNLRIILGMSF